ncbi:uncharacterized protein A4U43_C08F24330 [Asparagus officinalis]|nr:uncharacterized protein A4U43_C08F24330 [Asparagus officinalis]
MDYNGKGEKQAKELEQQEGMMTDTTGPIDYTECLDIRYEDTTPGFCLMVDLGIGSNRPTFLNLTVCVSEPTEADELREMVRREVLDEDFCIKNEMMGMHSRWGRVGALLRAYGMHPDVKIAELAARSHFELDCKNLGRYILRTQELVECFTHLWARSTKPKSDVIYKELEMLMLGLKQQGMCQTLKSVLHDVEEEVKESSLYLHCEKLANVFGIMNSEPESEIRVHKNMWVCGDCDTAAKFIPKVMGSVFVGIIGACYEKLIIYQF